VHDASAKPLPPPGDTGGHPTPSDETRLSCGGGSSRIFILKAPSKPGTYLLYFRMAHDGCRWFGEYIGMNVVVT
jgi:hypothetical protein